VPAADMLADGKTYDDVKDEYLEHMANRWREYAPNLTPDRYLAKYAYTPSGHRRTHRQHGSRCSRAADAISARGGVRTTF
jgi:hypothetical protein